MTLKCHLFFFFEKKVYCNVPVKWAWKKVYVKAISMRAIPHLDPHKNV